MGFVEKTTEALARGTERILVAEETARLEHLPQKVDPLVKLIAVIGLLLVVSLARDPLIILGVLVVALLTACSAGRGALRWWLRQGATVLPLSFMIALPAVVTTPGRPLADSVFGSVITEQGAQTALLLVLRVQAAAALGAVLILTTRWQHIVSALRAFRVPATITAVLTMTVRYIVLLVGTTADLFQARRSRLVARPAFATRWRLATSAAGALLSRSIHIADEVHLAMVARGAGAAGTIANEPTIACPGSESMRAGSRAVGF